MAEVASGAGSSTTGGTPKPPDPRWGSPPGTGRAPAAADGGDRVYFPGLDGLRAVAIVLVYVFHDRSLNLLGHLIALVAVPVTLLVDPLLRMAGLPDVGFRMPRLVSPLRQNGWIGVNIFFVLSGYLIATLLLRERERFGRVDLRSFWVRRALRIWPLYYLALVINFVVGPLLLAATGGDPAPWWRMAQERLPAFLLFLGNWSIVIDGPLPSDAIGVLWSVCVEEQFYLFVPLLVAWMGGRWRLGAIVGLMAAAIATRSWLEASGAEAFAVRFNTMANLDTLLAGVLLALVHWTWPGLKALPVWLGRLAVFGGGVALFLMPLAQGPAWKRSADVVLIWAWAAMLVWWASSERDRWSGVLRRPTMVWLGRISYGLYVYHMIGIELAGRIASGFRSLPEAGFIGALLGPVLTVAMASASYYGVERPFLRLKRRWTRVPSRPIDGEEADSPLESTAGDGTMAAPAPRDEPTSPGTPDPP